jgi:hypothetical protein
MKQTFNLLSIILAMVVFLMMPIISSAQDITSEDCGVICQSNVEQTDYIQPLTDSTMLALGYSMILIGFGFLVLNLQISSILEKRG